MSALSPRVAFLDHQRSLLTLGNSHLKQRIAALAQDKIFKDGDRHLPPQLCYYSIYRSHNVAVRIQFGQHPCNQNSTAKLTLVLNSLFSALLCSAHQEALKKEIERLRQIYHQQSLKNAESQPADAAPVRGSDNADLIGSEGAAAAAPCPHS